MRRWLVLLILSLFLLIPAVGDARTILAAAPISRLDLPWWRARHEAKLKELAEAKPQLIFLGDSITEGYATSATFVQGGYRCPLSSLLNELSSGA